MTAGRLTLGRLWALMLTAFLDMVGALMIVPVMPFYALRLGLEETSIGALTAIFFVAQLLTAPFWGRASDRHGRRPALMLGIVISTVAYLIFSFASSNWALETFGPTDLIALLFLSRFVQGVGGGTTGVIQAFVADSIRPEERAKALGWVSAATAAGVSLGPVLGSLAALMGPAAPGLVAAALCLVNIAFVRRYLEESTTHVVRESANLMASVSVRRRLVSVLSHPRQPISRLVIVYGAEMLAFVATIAMLALYLHDRFSFTEKNVWWVYTFNGVISFLMRSVVLGPAVSALGERGVMRAGLASLSVGFATLAVAKDLLVFGVGFVFVPIGTALLFPATSSLVSQFSERHEQGKVLGVQQAVGGVGRVLGPLLAGAAFEQWGPGAPYSLAAAISVLTLLFVLGLEAPPRAAPSAISEESPQAAG